MTDSDWDKVDRCGAGKFSTGPGDPFLPECVKHDYDYLGGGNLDAMIAADKRFYRGIWAKAIKNPLLLPRAVIYTALVALTARHWWRPYSRLDAEKTRAPSGDGLSRVREVTTEVVQGTPKDRL